MISFGLFIGLCFPFFALFLGIPAHEALQPRFFMATLCAGLLAGAANYLLARTVIRPRLQLLSSRMRLVEDTLQGATYTGDWSVCTPEHCRVPMDSHDEIGDAAGSFNDLVETLFRSHEVESAVSDFSNTLSSELDLDTLNKMALRQLMRHTNADAGALLVEAAGELRVPTRHGLRDPQQIAESDHVREALRTGDCRKIELPEDVRVESLLADVRPREIMVVPVTFKKTSMAVVVLASSTPFSHESEWLLGLFRQGLGLALNNALAHDRLQRMAAIDPLTGAYNRRFGATRLHEEFTRAERSNTPLGILMIDLDHFKSINDTYGHIVGDRVLSRVSEVVRSAMREGDILVRYGGEEFMTLLPGSSASDTLGIAERIRRMVKECEIKDGDQKIQVTASIGGIAYPDAEVESEEDLVRGADEALYSAKHGGRDKIEMA
jgi:diguanylate cyclase (GGDEF)-like protein